MTRSKTRREAFDRKHSSDRVAEPDRRSPATEVWLYGLHAVAAALANPARRPKRLLLTAETAQTLTAALAETPHAIDPAVVERRDIDPLLPPGAVHQGAAMLCAPLPLVGIEDIPDAPADGAPPPSRRVVVALDQVSDPHNVGAVLRSAAAFGALAVLITDRRAPEETGTIAKAACGALETVPLVRAVNFARALESLKAKGFWCVGLDGAAPATLAEQDLPEALVLVLGAEGAGLRRLTLETCDFTARLPIRPGMESLNVSNAAAVALYALLG
jgi:23S rRNA (guanosine2251-2'-O)-methyltransferase